MIRCTTKGCEAKKKRLTFDDRFCPLCGYIGDEVKGEENKQVVEK